MHIIFDLDDTLYSFPGPDNEAVGAMARYMKENFGWEEERTRKRIAESYGEVADRIGWNNPSIHNRLLRFKTVLETAGLPVYPHMWNLYNIYWDTILGLITPEPGLVRFMDEIKIHGDTIGVCSNMCTGIQHRKLMALGIITYFSHIVISEEVGTEKPDPVIFKRCADLENVTLSECIMIGDNFNRDCIGALKAGVKRAYWYRHAVSDSDFDAYIKEKSKDPFVSSAISEGRLRFIKNYDDMGAETL